MRIQTIIWRTLPAIIIVALCGVALPAPNSVVGAAQETNLLRNPGFEGEYSTWWEGSTPYVTAQMAPDWSPWWQRQLEGDPSWRNRMPEYKPAAPWQNRIRSGANAQQYFTFYGTHIAGIYQRVAVDPGSRLRFSIWAQVWSSAYDDASVSEADGEVNVEIGIDPTGGTDPLSAFVVWSNPRRQYDQWFQMSVEATASASSVTVFVWTEPQFPVKHNDIYLDDASLAVIGLVPTPTFEVVPTATPIEPTPIPTAVQPPATPLPQGSVLHTVVAGDTLFALAHRYGTTVMAIMTANSLTSDLLHIGQQLVIPTSQVQPTSTPPSPTQAPAPTAVPQQPAGTYVVQPGDNLFRIALRNNTTVDALAQLNGIVNPNLIRVGQVLQLGVGGAPPPAPPPPAGPRTHLIQPGENAFRIALRYGVTVEALASANNLVNPALIYAGQTLVIP
jgi:LysM repeat protein